MKKKILAITLCLAMLASLLAVGTYAEQYDVEIDLGGDFFEPAVSDKKPEDTNNNTGNNGNTGTGNGGTGSGGTSSRYEGMDIHGDKKEELPKVWTNPFVDIKESDWYFETVKYVSSKSIMNGVEADKFNPNASLTRAMLVTILYRAEGSPRISSDSKFSDVAIGDWYGASVIWANENGIVNGVSETEFAPNTAITREQIATIMYRYAKNYKKYDVSVGENTNILSYNDASEISSYAVEAIQYTAGSGLMKGKTETTINPKDNATRAEAATVVMRFIENNK